ncbi:uncharacterized protein LOC120281811 [Dioscorea cayenensis subsp. rotundata]|uniref:Uncharacterized protein LOC120281811 n=1 Tax=Dioscorea cayennensis subsp. rotundata TaxID=55577 RepID=A0AB40CWL4_DIOCR|nr:uncharacterized protein LOC120281811 [Dioscorea cayenensis subsp. rotundata]
MAHPSKFVSVNLNKSYGQPPAPSSSSAHGRPRPGTQGMVVLSRPRSSGSGGPKSVPKLSVPPPLNLPSLRKEHERFDSATGLGSGAGAGSSGSGSGTATLGWTKPGVPLADGGQQSSGSRFGGQPLAAAAALPARAVEKAVVLRGEDFPSLLASFSSPQKAKDSLKQKQEHGSVEKLELDYPLHMRPQMRSSLHLPSNVNEGDSLSVQKQPQKKDGLLPGPLPIVRLSHTSDWADDERDTGLSIPERERDRGFSRTTDSPDVWAARDSEGPGSSTRDFLRGDLFGRNLNDQNKEAGSWRMGQQQKDGFASRGAGVSRDGIGARPFNVSREMNKSNSFGHQDNARDGYGNGPQDSRYGRRDFSSGMNAQNGHEQNLRGRYNDMSGNRFRGDTFTNGLAAKGPFTSGSKGFSVNDPVLNFGREKRTSVNMGKPYAEAPGFDSGDLFSGDLSGDLNVKLFRKRKDVLKQADFHDPVRESFEAELERVQHMQEQQRQRVLEEQARALEIARKEEEERERLVREEEERRRLVEEEAREAAWRAEQERLEAVRRADELKIAREEERRRIQMEEERRKEAARQKLMELEAKIARRQAESDIKDDKMPPVVTEERVVGSVKETDAPRVTEAREWEDSERMVVGVTSSASSDSLAMNKSFDTGSRPQSLREGNLAFMDRGKPGDYWKRDAYDNGGNSMFFPQDQQNEYPSPRRDAFGSGRGFPRKDFYGNPGKLSTRSFAKGGTTEPSRMPDDHRYLRGDRWNAAGDGDCYSRNADLDAEFLDNDKFGDGGWGTSPSHGRPHSPYGERLFQNPEADGFSSFARSRHSMRQPRVLPPPVSSMQRSSFRAPSEHRTSSSYVDCDSMYPHSRDNEQEVSQAAYHGKFQEGIHRHGSTGLLEESSFSSRQEKNSPQCDSQSSLSVSSPPSSPSQPSHDDIDESGESATRPSTAIEGQSVLTDNENAVSSVLGEDAVMMTSSSVTHGEDEWAVDNNEEIQEQDEYDEEGDDYQEEDEAHERDNVNLDLSHEFEDLQADLQNTVDEMGQLVLGFNEGVEVKIPLNDETLSNSWDNGNTIGIEEGLGGGMTKLVSNDMDALQNEKAFPDGVMSSPAEMINESEKALQDLVLDQEAPCNQPLSNVDTFNISGMPPQQLPLPSASSIQPILSSVSTVSSQAEAPLKLQFGLFSGPSLIPSPVPAIQIGSIQMPLQLHPHVGPSMTQLHSSQPSFFQFGQLRYPPPISQGVLPLPQAMSFVQPSASPHYSFNQNLGGSLQNRVTGDTSSQNRFRDSVILDKQSAPFKKPFDLPQDERRQLNMLPEPSANEGQASHTHGNDTSSAENKNKLSSVSQAERHGVRNGMVKRNYRPVASKKESQPQIHAEPITSQYFSGEKNINQSKYTGIGSGSRGKRHVYTARITESRTPSLGPDASQIKSGGFQRRTRRNIRRTEFRVRGNIDGRQTEGVESYNYAGQEEEPIGIEMVSGTSYREKRDNALIKSSSMIENENTSSGSSGARVFSGDDKMVRVPGREVESNLQKLPTDNIPVGTLKRNGISEEDVDAPLQSGVVRVFKQPGIEAPSDEDDFIEVRSKRQMLNDRREQREKEIKAKSRTMKAPRKRSAVTQTIPVISNSNTAVTSCVGDVAINACSDPVVTSGRGFANAEPSPVFAANMTSQILPPIGAPAVNGESAARHNKLKSTQTPVSVISNTGPRLGPGLAIESKNAHDTAFGSWGHTDISQQVIALTQTQLDEAMNPARSDSKVSSNLALEHKVSMSNMTQDKPFTVSTSPLTSLLAGEKIQFGAVTLPPILPPVSRSVSIGIGPPGSKRSDTSNDHCAPVTHNNCTMFFDKEKHLEQPCAHLEDPEAEAEAEAAASAVAVAAISNNDEIIGNRASGSSVSVSDSKSLCSVDASGLTSGGGTANQEVTNHSAGEESLTVALPADLSVDTPTMSLWPPLPSPQNSSGPMLSHFPGAPPSHFPCFEMNPILGAPIFAFGSHDESVGTQAQPQRNSMLGSGPPGAWPPSAVDSFYGTPTGFSGPFISPSGIPGVQGPPHMVVYNHFTPVGQFGQVGLSFMGTTYIPTGKQLDWKQNPASSSADVREGDIGNLNVASGQRNPPSLQGPIQHIAPGSPLMPPLAMFDMSPFQSSAEIPMQARWPHIPAPSPLHTVPLTVAQQQHQVENGMPPHFSQSLHSDASTGINRLNEARSSTSGDVNRNFSLPTDASAPFPTEFAMVESSSAATSSVQTMRTSSIPASGNNTRDSSSTKGSTRHATANASDMGEIGTTSNNTDGHSVVPSLKSQSAQQLTSQGQQQYIHSVAYVADQRAPGASQKMVSGSDWHRRVGFHGRNQSLGSEKNFGSAKVKQIYVAKQPTGGPANPG